MPIELLVPIVIFVVGIIISHATSAVGVKLLEQNRKD